MNEKNILLLSDLEGIIGVYNLDEDEINKKLYMKEISIIFDTIIKNKFYNIYYCDIHDNGSMRLLLQDKYPNVHFIEEFINIDFNVHYEAAYLTGFHARCNTDGILCHSFRNDFYEVYLGDKVVGELEIYINWLSYYDIPIAFVSCDDVAMEEIRRVDCIKNISKSKNNLLNNNNFDKNYEKLSKNILLGLTNKHIGVTQYKNDKVRIKLADNSIIYKLDKKVFNIKNQLIEFTDTINFIEKIIVLANELNRLIYEEFNNNVNFINKLRSEYSHVKVENILDDKFSKIINKDFSTLDEDERQYILKVLEQYV